MKTAYSFVRWSTRRQSRESSDSKRRQLKSAEEWCQANGCQLSTQVFIGASESGFKGQHLKTKDGIAIGALARFIQAVEKGMVKSSDVLCIDSVDSREGIGLADVRPYDKTRGMAAVDYCLKREFDEKGNERERIEYCSRGLEKAIERNSFGCRLN